MFCIFFKKGKIIEKAVSIFVSLLKNDRWDFQNYLHPQDPGVHIREYEDTPDFDPYEPKEYLRIYKPQNAGDPKNLETNELTQEFYNIKYGVNETGYKLFQ